MKKNKPKQVKIRRSWDINPRVRVKQSDKAYYRNREKGRLKRIIKEDASD